MAGDPPVTDISGWLTPEQAIEILNPVFGANGSGPSKRVLLERLRGGMVPAACYNVRTGGFKPEERELSGIKRTVWENVDEHDPLWQSDDLTLHEIDPHSLHGGTRAVRLYGIRFEPNAVRAIIAGRKPRQAKPVATPKPAEAVTPAPVVVPSGRPRKDWWDDFWIDICGQIYEGILKPKTQADLARAMHDWAVAHDHDIGETTIKAAARKLFQAWKLNG